MLYCGGKRLRRRYGPAIPVPREVSSWAERETAKDRLLTTSEPCFERRSAGTSRYRGYERQRKLQAGWNRGILKLYPTPEHSGVGFIFFTAPILQGGKYHVRRNELHL